MRTRLFSLILALFAVLLPAKMWAQDKPYAALYVNETDTLLNFTYGGTPSEYVIINHVVYDRYDDATTPEAEEWYWDVTNTNDSEIPSYKQSTSNIKKTPWYDAGYNTSITIVNFDSSFERARPISCAYWFATPIISAYDKITHSSSYTSNSRLQKIQGLEYLNTSATINMMCMFSGCIQLKSIDVSHFDTSKVQCFWSMFNQCHSLESIDVTNFNTSSVTNMCAMFSYCKQLHQLDINNFDTSNVLDMCNMFAGCSELVYLDLSSFNTSKTSDFSGMFQRNYNLRVLNLGNFDLSNLGKEPRADAPEKETGINRIFQYCTQLRTIYSSSWNLSDFSTNSKSYMFEGCANLVGGIGTVFNESWDYDSNIDDSEFAQIDENGHPGYFTSVGEIPSVNLSANTDNSTVLTANYGKIVNVTINREFAANTWTTLTLPYNTTHIQLSTVFGNGTEIKKLIGASYSNSSFAPVYEDANNLQAGTPYLIKPAQAVTSFTFNKPILASTASSITAGGLTMTGTFSPATVTPTEAYRNLYTPTSADYATLAQDADNSESVNGFQAYFTSINGTEYTLKVSSAGAATLYLPFNAQIPEDADYFIAAGLKEIDDIADNASIGRLRMIKQGIIPANTGVVILANPGSYTLRATEEETEETAAAATSENYSLLSGTLEATNTQALREANPGHTIYTLSRGTQQNFGFKPSVTGKVAVAQYRAYLAIATPAGAPVRDISLTFGDAELDEATGINEVNLNVEKASDGIYYNLNGQRVTVPTKGIYIKDGKKVYVK